MTPPWLDRLSLDRECVSSFLVGSPKSHPHGTGVGVTQCVSVLRIHPGLPSAPVGRLPYPASQPSLVRSVRRLHRSPAKIAASPPPTRTTPLAASPRTAGSPRKRAGLGRAPGNAGGNRRVARRASSSHPRSSTACSCRRTSLAWIYVIPAAPSRIMPANVVIAGRYQRASAATPPVSIAAPHASNPRTAGRSCGRAAASNRCASRAATQRTIAIARSTSPTITDVMAIRVLSEARRGVLGYLTNSSCDLPTARPRLLQSGKFHPSRRPEDEFANVVISLGCVPGHFLAAHDTSNDSSSGAGILFRGSAGPRVRPGSWFPLVSARSG
jgi:hypothetical protein